jgi:imidazolonepropionase-like amidohydrolase
MDMLRIIIIAVSAALIGWPAFATQDLLLKNVNVVDPKSKTIQKRNVLIHDGKILSVTEESLKNYAGETMDLSGKYLSPSFSDMHVHANANQGLNNTFQELGFEGVAKNNMLAGVTTMLDLFNQEDEILAFRNSQKIENLTGAELFSAGALFTCKGGHGTEYAGVKVHEINSAAEAESAMSEFAKVRPDVVKIVYDHAWTAPSMDKATMTAAITSANKLGLKTVIHIGTWQDAKEAVLAGATAITHLHFSEVPDDVVKLIGERKVWIIPTMAVQSDMANLIDNPEILKSPLAKRIVPGNILESYKHFDPASSKFHKWFYEFQKTNKVIFQASLKKLADAGAQVMTGTDVPNIGTFVGFSLHREMKLMVDAGLSPWQALEAATTLPGEFLGKNYGVTPGSIANLVVLSASPIEDIENTQKIELVIHYGKVAYAK